MTSVGRLIIIPPHGEITDNRINAAPTLAELQHHVGGYVQIVPEFNTYDKMNCEVYVNEEGLLIGQECNGRASDAYRQQLRGPYNSGFTNLVGPAVIVIGKRYFMR